MAKVIIGPVMSRWETTPDEDGLIFNAMTAVVKGRWYNPRYRRGQWDGCVHLYQPNRKRLPSGLVPDAVAVLESAGHSVEVFESMGKDIPLREDFNIHFDLTEHQIQALEAMSTNYRGVVHAATNAGKTKIAAAWCAMHKAKILHIVPSIDLLRQTVDSFRRDTDLRVGSISAVDGWDPGEDVTVCLVSSVARRKQLVSGKLINKGASGRFAQLAATFDAAIFDECHHIKATTWQIVARLLTGCVRWYGLSGTPWDDSNQEEVLQVKAFLGPIICRIENADLIEIGWSASPTIKLIKSLGTPIKSKEWMEVYDAGITYNTGRNSQIVEICKKIAATKKQALVFTQRLPQGRLLSEMLTRAGISHRVISGKTFKFYRQQYFNDFKNGKFSILISNVMGEGVDIPSLNALIFASGGKSPKKVLQQVGRGIRRKPTGDNTVEIYDFRDWFHDYLERHSRRRVALYKSEGFKIVEVEVAS